MADILVVPETDRRNGVGHFKRLVFYMTHGQLHADILVPTEDARAYLSPYAPPLVRKAFVSTVPADRTYTVLIADTFVLRASDVRRYRRYAKVICALDARGTGASYCDYIIDILPRVRGAKGNITAPQLLPIALSGAKQNALSGAKQNAPPSAERNVMIYLGGAPRAHLMSKAIRRLKSAHPTARLAISIVTPHPSPADDREARREIRRMRAKPHWVCTHIYAPHSLDEYIARSDTVITHFGLTALTAMLIGKEVLIIDRTRYHAQCTRSLYHSISRPNGYSPLFFSPARFYELIDAISRTHPTECPVCRGNWYRIYARFAFRSFARCSVCRMHFVILHAAQPTDYGEGYFDSEYRNQYGKTYLEDFDHIYRLGVERLRIISALHSSRPRSLLDIGCAYGPFLSAAKERDFDCYGIDVNREAIAYAQAHVAAQVAHCSIEQCDPMLLFQRHSFSVITMWYVIEHFSVLEPVLRKIHALLPMGGLFAFSTPNRRGLSFRVDRTAALHSSPVDHYTVWGGREAKAILLRFGLKVVRTVMHGVHPQQYPHIPPAVSRFLSIRCGQGSTFSIYARKIHPISQ